MERSSRDLSALKDSDRSLCETTPPLSSLCAFRTIRESGRRTFREQLVISYDGPLVKVHREGAR